jgi:hypothetical protein
MAWRPSTLDVDVHLVPDRDEILRAMASLKNDLEINIELAAPSHFIPELPGWQERSQFIAGEGKISFFDVDSMIREGLVEPGRLRELFEGIIPALYRYPAIDAQSFRQALNEALAARE